MHRIGERSKISYIEFSDRPSLVIFGINGLPPLPSIVPTLFDNANRQPELYRYFERIDIRHRVFPGIAQPYYTALCFGM